MSSKSGEELKKMVKDLGRLVTELKSSKKDRKLKGLLLHLKKEVLRNSEMAVNFRELDGVKLVRDTLEKHSLLRDSIVATCFSLLANLAALDVETKKYVCMYVRTYVCMFFCSCF